METKVIGSACIKHHWPDYPYGVNDIDVLGGTEKGCDNLPFLDCFDYPGEYLTKDDIYTLKISHAIYDIKRGKHLKDIVFMKSKGCTINKDALAWLIEFWKIRHGDREHDMNVDSSEFFHDNIDRFMNHDELHNVVAYYPGRPAYQYIKTDEKTASVDEWRFHIHVDNIQRNIAREEPIVIGLERTRCRRLGWQVGVKKCIVSLFPVWLAVYCLDNFAELYDDQFKEYYEECRQKVLQSIS